MFDPWIATLEEAMAAEVAADAGPSLRSPMLQWHAAREVESQRAVVEGGDGLAVLSCIYTCMTHGLVAPEWLAGTFNSRYLRVTQARVGSWDKAFGRPSRGKHLAAVRQRLELRFKILNRVNEIAGAGVSIDQSLFETVANELGIGKTLCADLYYEAKKITSAK